MTDCHIGYVKRKLFALSKESQSEYEGRVEGLPPTRVAAWELRCRSEAWLNDMSLIPLLDRPVSS